MNWYKLAQNTYYHGSYDKLSDGTILTPSKGNFMGTFSQDEMDSHFKLEQFKPSKFLSRNNAIYMCDNMEDIDNAGGATDHLYEVVPTGTVEKHDLNWMGEIDMIMEKYWTAGRPDDAIEEVQAAALKYWNGVPHYNENVWEYLVPSARIVREV